MSEIENAIFFIDDEMGGDNGKGESRKAKVENVRGGSGKPGWRMDDSAAGSDRQIPRRGTPPMDFGPRPTCVRVIPRCAGTFSACARMILACA